MKLFELLNKATPRPWRMSRQKNPAPQYTTTWHLDSATRKHMAVLTVMDINSNPKWQATHPEAMAEQAEMLAEVSSNAALVPHMANTYEELGTALEQLAEAVERVHTIYHCGGSVLPKDWSELYRLTNESRAALEKADNVEEIA